MLFSSLIFLWVFLPLTIIAMLAAGGKYANYVLLAASLIFYAWGEPVYILLMLFSIVFNWACGLAIDRRESAKAKKRLLTFAVCINLLLLGYFKYFGMLASLFASLFSAAPNIGTAALPIGISFFTFQAMSYVIDVYRGECRAEKNLANVALYVSFFPQLIAGPIVKYKDISEQLRSREVTSDGFTAGIRRFVYGLAKKVLIAHVLAQSVDSIYALELADMTGTMAWAAAIMYAFQIYYDFSGYSDMAIGLAAMCGFKLKENFNYPYIACSVRDFWRRWHISLSEWFRDYLYIPLGGSRRGKARTAVNLLIVFALTGLWHGAGINFILWGLWHGLFMIIERLGWEKILKKVKFLGWLYTMAVVGFGWVIFRVENLNKAFGCIRIMLSPLSHRLSSVFTAQLIDDKTIFALTAAVLCCGIMQLLLKKERIREAVEKMKFSSAEAVFCFILLVLCILSLAANTYNPFIYYRF